MPKQPKPPGSNRRLVTSTAPAPVAATIELKSTVGRYCSSCLTVRPVSMFAPSSAGFGILNWICRVCDGTYIEPTPTDILERQLVAMTAECDRLRNDIAGLSVNTVTKSDQMLVDRLRLDLDEANRTITDQRIKLLAAKKRLKAVDERGGNRPPADAEEEDEVVIPESASVRIEKNRLADGRIHFDVFVDDVPVHGDIAPDRSAADVKGRQWIASHREVTTRDEGVEKMKATKRGKSEAETPELEATN